MKKIMILMAALLITGIELMAQDVIYFKNGNQQKGKVQEIRSNEIVYKKAENMDGPAYTSYISDVQMIEYANGYKEIFSQSNNGNSSGSNQSNNNNQQPQNSSGNTYQNNYYSTPRPNVNVNINPVPYVVGGWGGGYYGGGWGPGYYAGGWGHCGGGYQGGHHHHYHHR